jgi:hypothetical protein
MTIEERLEAAPPRRRGALYREQRVKDASVVNKRASELFSDERERIALPDEPSGKFFTSRLGPPATVAPGSVWCTARR